MGSRVCTQTLSERQRTTCGRETIPSTVGSRERSLVSLGNESLDLVSRLTGPVCFEQWWPHFPFVLESITSMGSSVSGYTAALLFFVTSGLNTMSTSQRE